MKYEFGHLAWFVVVALFVLSSTQAFAAGVLRVHPTNRRCFADDSGKAIYLAGSHAWYILHEHRHGVDLQRCVEFANWLQSWGHNYTRLWCGWSYLKNSSGEPQQPWPWQRTGPGTASDGSPKFDMTVYNQVYFDLLKACVQELANRGIYCSMMIFGSFNGFRNNYTNVAWHPGNNINPELQNLSTTNADSFFNMRPEVLAIQEAHVRKMIDELNGFDNIIWEVMNETRLPAGKDWQCHMINYINEYEQTKPKQHLVLFGGGCSEASGTMLQDSPADVISPDGATSGDYGSGGDASYDGKIVVNDTDHLWGYSRASDVQTHRKWVWRTFARGNHPIYMDNYDAFISYNATPGVVDPRFNPVRKALGDVVAYAKRIDLAAAIPTSNTSDCSTGYLLRDPGTIYLAYHPGGSSLMLYLQVGTYQVEYFDAEDGSTSTGTVTQTSDGSREFSRPAHASDDWALLLTRTGDADGDGLPDEWELTYFSDLSQGAGGNHDDDGLTNLEEYEAGTDPTDADTDGDGILDGDDPDPTHAPESFHGDACGGAAAGEGQAARFGFMVLALVLFWDGSRDTHRFLRRGAYRARATASSGVFW